MSSPSSGAPALPQNVPVERQFLLCLPCYGAQMTRRFVSSLIETMQATNIIGQIEFLDNDSLVSRARNTLAATFLRSPYEWLMFIDCDIQFAPEHVVRLWLHATQHDRRIVGGLYALKQITPQFVANWLPGEKPDHHGAVKVSEIGTGFLVVHRSVFETMRERLPEISYLTDPTPATPERQPAWDFFGVGPYDDKATGTRRYLSEDWMFCRRARDLGFDVWADTMIQLSHVGNFCFPPEVPALVNAVKTVRAMGHPLLPKELV